MYYLYKFIEFVREKMKLLVDYDSLSAIAPDKIQIMMDDYITVLKKRVNSNSILTFYCPV